MSQVNMDAGDIHFFVAVQHTGKVIGKTFCPATGLFSKIFAPFFPLCTIFFPFAGVAELTAPAHTKTGDWRNRWDRRDGRDAGDRWNARPAWHRRHAGGLLVKT